MKFWRSMKSRGRGLITPPSAHSPFSRYFCLHCRIRIATRSLSYDPTLSPHRERQNTHSFLQSDLVKQPGKSVRTAPRKGDHTTSILVAAQTTANYTTLVRSHCTQNLFTALRGVSAERCPIGGVPLREYQARKSNILRTVETIVKDSQVQDLHYKIYEAPLGLEEISPQLKEPSKVPPYNDNGSTSHETLGSDPQYVLLAINPLERGSAANSGARWHFHQVQQREANFRRERDGNSPSYKCYCSSSLGLRPGLLLSRKILQKRAFTTNSVGGNIQASLLNQI